MCKTSTFLHGTREEDTYETDAPIPNADCAEILDEIVVNGQKEKEPKWDPFAYSDPLGDAIIEMLEYDGQESETDCNNIASVAWTPDGDTQGNNPRRASSRYNTDLSGESVDANKVFSTLSRIPGDTEWNTRINKDSRLGAMVFGVASDIQYRANLDGESKIDIPPNSF